ncbi:MAG: hypothetical protein ABI813_06735 [Bacteroidota bacterium]
MDTADGRVLMELDQLYKALDKPVDVRIELLENFPLLMQDRDDLYLEYITLLNCKGKYNKPKN